MWKQFSLIWGAALVLALVNRFVLFQDVDSALLSQDGLFMFAFMAVIVAMFVIAIIFVVNRFSKGLLGNEGYLMHTLPVRPWHLVASKLICGVVTWLIPEGNEALDLAIHHQNDDRLSFLFKVRDSPGKFVTDNGLLGCKSRRSDGDESVLQPRGNRLSGRRLGAAETRRHR
jgi:hypothetical protein